MLALALLLLQTILFITAPAQLASDPCGCEDKPQVNILAVVNGVKITKQELGSGVQNQITTLHNEVMRARDVELDLQINRYLIDAEAKKRGLTPQQFVKLVVVDTIPDPTQAEVEIFYKERKDRMPGDFKTVKPKIISLIRTERETLAATKLALDLRAAANVKMLVQSVTPPANEDDLNRVFAIAGTRKFTSRDIEEGLAPLIFSVREQVYSLRQYDLDLRINDMLLEQEAKRQNSTPDAVLAKAIRARLPIITDQQAKSFYDENKRKLNGDFAKLKFQIIQILMRQEQEKLSKAFAAELRHNAAVQIYLTPPESPSFKISSEDQPTRGNLKARVTVVQFTDFECPSCAKQHGDFERLVAEFGAQVKFVVRDYPLSQHKNAIAAAEAAEAAREQGKYWEYAELLYSNQESLQPEKLKKYASQLGLDRARFDAALDSHRFNSQVQRDIDDGERLRIDSSPVFFVNGKRVSDYSYDSLKAAIQLALKRGGS